MKLIYCIIITLLLLISCDVLTKINESDWEQNSDEREDIINDNTDYIYVVGFSNNGSNNDFNVLRYDSTGRFYDSHTFNGGYDDIAYAAVCDSIGNLYVTGSMGNDTDDDYLTIKYNRDMNIEWQRPYDNGGDDVARGIVVDNNNFIYVTGYSLVVGDYYVYHTIKYDQNRNIVTEIDTNVSTAGDDYGTAIAIDKNTGYIYLTGYAYYNSYDYQTVKYDLNLVEIIRENWPRIYPDPSDLYIDRAYGIVVDSNDNIYVTGYSYNGIDNDFYTTKYDTNGNLITTDIWPRLYNSIYNDNDYAYGIAVDFNDNIYVTGFSYNGIDNDFCTVKYNSSGYELWNRIYNDGADDQAFAVAVDQQGFIYVAGTSQNTMNMDFLIIKYDTNGNIIWTRRFDSGYEDEARGICIVN